MIPLKLKTLLDGRVVEQDRVEYKKGWNPTETIHAKEALAYIKNQIIVERVVKVEGRAEADRFFNFPYGALEESLANACQHKSYQISEPVEIRIYLNRIMIINYPGPEPWIDMDEFREGKAISRRYRNRRIGEFFKEIDLAEKMSTGITKILRTLSKNGSPPPTFKTDPERHSLETTIWIHRSFEKMAGSFTENFTENFTESFTDKLSEKEKSLLGLIENNPNITTVAIAAELGVSRQTIAVSIKTLKEKGVINRIGSDKKGKWEIIKEKQQI